MKFTDPKVQSVFEAYEARRAGDDERMRTEGPKVFAARDEFLLPVGPDVGWFLHALITARRPKRIAEFGTSYGYSTLFMANAAREVGAQIVSMEVADYKQDYAREQLAAAGLADHVEFRLGDAVALTRADEGVFDFALLDIWKELYLPCFEALYPKLSDEGIIASDNMVYPEMARPDVRRFREAVRAKPDLQTVLLPIGHGIELSVRWDTNNAKL